MVSCSSAPTSKEGAHPARSKAPTTRINDDWSRTLKAAWISSNTISPFQKLLACQSDQPRTRHELDMGTHATLFPLPDSLRVPSKVYVGTALRVVCGVEIFLIVGRRDRASPSHINDKSLLIIDLPVLHAPLFYCSGALFLDTGLQR